MREIPARKVKFFTESVLAWYDENGRNFPWRKKRESNYRKVVVEVLLQRTRAETVAAFYPRFFKKYGSFRALAGTRISELEKDLKPIGLWKRRAVSLKDLGKAAMEHGGRFPGAPEEFDNFPAVGQYVGNAARVFVYNEKAPLLDANMARVLERFFGPREKADIRFDPYIQNLAHYVVENQRCIETSWSILDLAALVCKVRRPNCNICPVSKKCQFGKITLSN